LIAPDGLAEGGIAYFLEPLRTQISAEAVRPCGTGRGPGRCEASDDGSRWGHLQ
jgi:hypothetical protein